MLTDEDTQPSLNKDEDLQRLVVTHIYDPALQSQQSSNSMQSLSEQNPHNSDDSPLLSNYLGPNNSSAQHGRAHRIMILRNTIAFFICGLMNNFSYVVMLSAAEDMVQGLSGIVLLCNILPTFIIDNTAPFFMHWIPYPIRVVVCVFFALASFQTVAWFQWPVLKLLGVVFASISCGFGEISFLAMSSYYDKNTVAGWSSGTGAAGIFGAFSYLALRTWLGLSPFWTLIIITPLPFLMLVSYFLILTGNERKRNATKRSSEPDAQGNSKKTLTLKQRVRFLLPMMKYMIPLFAVYHSEYLINQGIAPDITFQHNVPSIMQGPKQQYMYYQFLYQVGVFVSRSSVKFFHIKWVWLPATLQCINMAFLYFAALFQFIPLVYIVLLIIFWEGLLGGSTYVNVYYLISSEVPEDYREFSMGMASAGTALGISLAAVASIILEPWLKNNHWPSRW